MDLIQFAGAKIEKADIMFNLAKLMKLGGTVYVGSAIASKLLYDPEGQALLKQLQTKFNILREGQMPAPDQFNLAIPEVLAVSDIRVKGQSKGPGYPDITDRSAQWIIAIIKALNPNAKILFNGIVSYKEAGRVDTTKAVIEAIAELKRTRGALITLIGGDGPANFKEFSGLTAEDWTEFSGGGVPLKYGTEGEKKLPMVKALSEFNRARQAI
jgi:hypothetical protein